MFSLVCSTDLYSTLPSACTNLNGVAPLIAKILSKTYSVGLIAELGKDNCAGFPTMLETLSNCVFPISLSLSTPKSIDSCLD